MRHEGWLNDNHCVNRAVRAQVMVEVPPLSGEPSKAVGDERLNLNKRGFAPEPSNALVRGILLHAKGGGSESGSKALVRAEHLCRNDRACSQVDDLIAASYRLRRGRSRPHSDGSRPHATPRGRV